MSNEFVGTFNEGETPPASPTPLGDAAPVHAAERSQQGDFAKAWDELEGDQS